MKWFTTCVNPECSTPPGLCHCGCGGVSPLWPANHHIRLDVQGKPRLFIHGHNQRGKARPEHAERMRQWAAEHPEHMERLVALGKAALPSERTPEHVEHWKAARIRSNTWRLAAAEHPLWKGGTTVTNGYVLVYSPEHPFPQKLRYVKRARLVVEAHLRKTDPTSPCLVDVNGTLYLRPDRDTHHLNEDKQDDRVENLVALTHAEHARLHGKVRKHVLRRRGAAPRSALKAAAS